jgi:transcriptional regulator with XRE-family HTH domain
MKKPDAHQRLGKWLKERRMDAGLTQVQLAAKVGRHKTFIAKYEAGRRLEVEAFVKIAKVLKADPHEAIDLLIR